MCALVRCESHPERKQGAGHGERTLREKQSACKNRHKNVRTEVHAETARERLVVVPGGTKSFWPTAAPGGRSRRVVLFCSFDFPSQSAGHSRQRGSGPFRPLVVTAAVFFRFLFKRGWSTVGSTSVLAIHKSQQSASRITQPSLSAHHSAAIIRQHLARV